MECLALELYTRHCTDSIILGPVLQVCGGAARHHVRSAPAWAAGLVVGLDLGCRSCSETMSHQVFALGIFLPGSLAHCRN